MHPSALPLLLPCTTICSLLITTPAAIFFFWTSATLAHCCNMCVRLSQIAINCHNLHILQEYLFLFVIRWSSPSSQPLPALTRCKKKIKTNAQLSAREKRIGKKAENELQLGLDYRISILQLQNQLIVRFCFLAAWFCSCFLKWLRLICLSFFYFVLSLLTSRSQHIYLPV